MVEENNMKYLGEGKKKKTSELYLKFIKGTLNGGSCALTPFKQVFECDWLILNTATSPVT